MVYFGELCVFIGKVCVFAYVAVCMFCMHETDCEVEELVTNQIQAC